MKSNKCSPLRRKLGEKCETERGAQVRVEVSEVKNFWQGRNAVEGGSGKAAVRELRRMSAMKCDETGSCRRVSGLETPDDSLYLSVGISPLLLGAREERSGGTPPSSSAVQRNINKTKDNVRDSHNVSYATLSCSKSTPIYHALAPENESAAQSAPPCRASNSALWMSCSSQLYCPRLLLGMSCSCG